MTLTSTIISKPASIAGYFAPFEALVYSRQDVTRCKLRTLQQAETIQIAGPSQNPLRGGMVHPLTLALYQPDIPQNTGTMLRTCACLGLAAAIIEPAGFPISDRHFRRSGMDYLDHVPLERHISWRAFEDWRRTNRAQKGGARLVLLSTKANLTYTKFAYQPGDILMVGRESAGVPDEVHAAADERILIPVQAGLRSLNVAMAAAMVMGEALRQITHTTP
jgi:tRNA (cytidine/uridine-2'-O-)-methyltransferase